MSISKHWSDLKLSKFLNARFENGAAGQTLVKTTNTNWDFEWQTIALSGNTVTEDIDVGGNNFTDIKLTDYTITNATVSSLSGTLTLNYEAGPHFDTTLTENVTTVDIVNVPASGCYAEIQILLTQDATARTVTWPASFKWPGGSAPDLTTVNSIHVIHALTIDNGTNWYATFASDFA